MGSTSTSRRLPTHQRGATAEAAKSVEYGLQKVVAGVELRGNRGSDPSRKCRSNQQFGGETRFNTGGQPNSRAAAVLNLPLRAAWLAGSKVWNYNAIPACRSIPPGLFRRPLMVASVWMLAGVALAAAPYEEGTLLTYRGSFQPVKLERPDAGKSFELSVLIGRTTDDATEVYWLLADTGRNPIPWSERWGKLAWSRDKKTIEGPIPGFLYEHVSGKTPVNIAPPLPLFDEELKSGATWLEGKVEVTVTEGEAVNDRPTWDIVARTLIGRRRTMTIDREDQRVYALRENVFVGQGDEHLLKYQLVESKRLDGDALTTAAAAFDAWTGLREEWKGAMEDRAPQSIAAARKGAAAKVPELRKASEGTPLAALADVAARQLKSDDEQTAAVGAMRTRAIGKPLAKFELKDTAGKASSNEGLAGKVTILHFWSYRDENLREPYGQVGYLDFVARKYDAAKIQVIGVAVAPEDPDQLPGQRGMVRRFRDFMNLSYPVLLDDGSLLDKLGDPRKAGQELPLFVVVDGKGNVVEYKAGLYEVKRDQGLNELEAIVKKAAAPGE